MNSDPTNPSTDLVDVDKRHLVVRSDFDTLDLTELGETTVWEDLSGDKGLYRNRDTKLRPCLLQATNDWEAMAEFLATVPKSPQTFRSYQKECLRLLLICRFYFRKPVSSLTLADVDAYKHLLRQPPTAFVQPRRSKVDPEYVPVTLFLKRLDEDGQVLLDATGKPTLDFNPHWRPFQKPLSASSATTALSIVKAVMSFWVKANYLSVSPFSLIVAKSNDVASTDSDPRARMALGTYAQSALLQELDAMPTRTERQRLRQIRAAFIFECLMTLGIRMAELTRATMTDVHREHGAWWFRAAGKGNKERNIPAVARFMRTYQDYRLSIDLPKQPAKGEAMMPLIQYVNPGNRKAISEYQIRKVVAPLFKRAADRLEALSESVDDSLMQMDMNSDAQKLKNATPHWLRHTYATNLHNADVDPRIIQTCLGHASINTTMIYSHTEARERHQALEKAFEQ